MRIIGLAGKKGSGKDYLAAHKFLPELEKEGYKVLMISFADQLKVVTSTISGNMDVFSEEKSIESRKMLQSGGQDMRDSQGDDIWVKFLASWLQALRRNGFTAIIIPDVRFPDEVKWINSHKESKIYRVISDRKTTSDSAETDAHISEHALDDHEFEIIYNWIEK